MTQRHEVAISWLKLFTPLVIFLLSLAVWGARLEDRVNNEIVQRQKDYNSVEYIRRQNEKILQQIQALNTNVEWLKTRCGTR